MHEVKKVCFNKYKYKGLLNIKYKNLNIKQNKNNINKIYYPSKIQKYKDMIMIRLSNKSIQIIFDCKDGFIYQAKF